MIPLPNRFRPVFHRAAATLLVLGACALWASWSVLAEMGRRWEVDPTYAHGYIVPVVALAILWARRARMPAASSRPGWWGLGLIALGSAMQILGAFYYVRWLCGAAILAYLGGMAALVGGWPALRWAAPGIGFLAFMIPLPYRVDVLLRHPLQRISALSSGCALQMLGLPAVVEGNVIALNDVELDVVDACSGLKMFILFLCLSTALALLVRRGPVERLLIVLSAAPIAIVCNVARITATGVMHELAGARWAELVFHDLAGWLMMPLALGLLWCELRLLSLIVVVDEPARVAPRPAPDDPAHAARPAAGLARHPVTVPNVDP
jgi:exosortase